MNSNALVYRYPSRRNVVYGKNGMVATGNPVAAQAGLDVLKKGGNAIDAAVAAAACLTVAEPTGNGIGGDAFALVWVNGKLHGLNASGPSPVNLTADMLRAKGLTSMPKYGWDAVTVPGIPSAWAALTKKFGKLSLCELVKPAAEYASEGYPLAVNVAKLWASAYAKFKNELKEDHFKHWFDTFIPDGVCPGPGDIWRNEGMAATLREIGETNAESFYRGKLAEKIIAFSKATGGYLTEKDLGDFCSEWVDPISVNYKGYDVYEIPPNGHGITVLMALNILKGMDLGGERDTLGAYHKQIEAIKLAFADTEKYVTDPRHMTVTVGDLLSDAYADERRKLIGEKAIMPQPGKPQSSGTVYLAAADNEGNMISYIQSNYMGFGSGLVVPGTGIALHNRGNNFSLTEGHDNCYAPGKKPYHTIIPGFMSKDGKAVGPFGVMGGFMQPQGHLQVVTNTVDFGLNPQDCLDAPRWQWVGGKTVEIEQEVPMHIIQSLAKNGHDIKVLYDYILMGRGEIIWRLENGVLVGGAEPRTDGTVAAW